MTKIGIIGDGGWGTTLAILLSGKGFEVALWSAFPDYVKEMISSGENKKFLPGVKIPSAVKLTASAEDAFRDSRFIVLAVPSQFMRKVLSGFRGLAAADKIIVSVTKGIENSTLKRMTEVIGESLGPAKIAVLSGPTIALEVAARMPTTAVVASADSSAAKAVQDIFMAEHFRIYTSDDVIGVEVGGSVKNTVAIAAGVLDGLGLGANSKAALLTRGLVEITRLGTAMGGRRETFYGLSGLGDLTTTCISRHSRNRHLGEEIGRGRKLKEILAESDMVVEGVATTKSAHELAGKYKAEMPITAEVHKVLYEGKDPRVAIRDLMTRSPKNE